MKLKSTGQTIKPTGVIKTYNERQYWEVYIPIKRKFGLPQVHLQFVRKDNILIK